MKSVLCLLLNSGMVYRMYDRVNYRGLDITVSMGFQNKNFTEFLKMLKTDVEPSRGESGRT